MEVEEIASQIVDSAIKVHPSLGPGLLETAYQTCLAYDLRQRGRTVSAKSRYQSLLKQFAWMPVIELICELMG